MDWNRAMTITQVALLLALIFGGIYFYNRINERQEIFDHVLDYVLEEYRLKSCSCVMDDGSAFNFDESSYKMIVKNDYNISDLYGLR